MARVKIFVEDNDQPVGAMAAVGLVLQEAGSLATMIVAQIAQYNPTWKGACRFHQSGLNLEMSCWD